MRSAEVRSEKKREVMIVAKALRLEQNRSILICQSFSVGCCHLEWRAASFFTDRHHPLRSVVSVPEAMSYIHRHLSRPDGDVPLCYTVLP